ncbi:XRCC6 [Symbiodinium microadriaticum]|nr:XRCC6 [Symbiodinium microadriaticum]
MPLCSACSNRTKDVERVVRMRTHRKRTLQRLAFHLCPGVEASVSVFVTMLEAKVPPPVYLLNENNKPLKAESKQICEQTGALLHPVDDIATYVEVAGHRIFVTRAETQEAKHFGDPSLRVLGFKPLSSLQDHHRMFHAYFVYPNERGFTGSAALLSSLVSVMLERKVLALASYVARRNSEPVLVALLPQAEVEEEGDQRQPPGFHMVRLPWAEVKATSPPKAPLGFPLADGFPAVMPENLKERAQEVVRSLQLPDFVPGCAENPVLQKHYAAVQALALSEEQPEETVDVLQPDAAHLETKKPLFLAWKEAPHARRFHSPRARSPKPPPSPRPSTQQRR